MFQLVKICQITKPAFFLICLIGLLASGMGVCLAQSSPTASAYPAPTSPTTPPSFSVSNPPGWSAGTAGGTIFSPLPPLDPYGSPKQSAIFPPSSKPMTGSFFGNSPQGGSSFPSGDRIYSGNFENFFPETYEAVRRFRDSTSTEFTFLPRGNASDSFGLSQLDLRMQLAIPCRFVPTLNDQPGFFMLTPGVQFAWWNGPVGPPDMSPNGFGAYLDLGVQPQFNDVFAMNAWFRVGLFSDFKHLTSDAFRLQGGIEGVVNLARDVQVVVGVKYLDRERIKMLPTGGILWTPRDDWRFRLTFPDPKISKRLWQTDRAVWWGYLRAEYAGEAWDIDGLGKTDYNDVRLGLGMEFETISHLGGYVEFGGSFGRELYSNNKKWASPSNVLFLKTGFVF